MLGNELARRDHICVNGAGAHGVMGALNRAARTAGGKVIGVCHRMFVDGEIQDLFEGFELVLTGGEGLEERKRALAVRADCFIALPGGPGTCERLLLSLLRMHRRVPVVRAERLLYSPPVHRG